MQSGETRFYSDVGVEALLDTLANALPQAKAYKHCHTLRNVKDEALIERLADIVAEAKAATFSTTLSDVEDEAVIDTLANMYRWRWPTQLTSHWVMCRHKG